MQKSALWKSSINLCYWGYIFWKIHEHWFKNEPVMYKCNSTSHGITVSDMLLQKKQKYVKPKNWTQDHISIENITFWEICSQIWTW